MLNCQNEQKDKTSSPSGETSALLGQDDHQMTWNVAPAGPPASCQHVPNQPTSKLPRPLEIVQASMVTSYPSWSMSICQGLFPTSLCQKRPDEGVLPPLRAWAHHKTLSCICHPNVHLMGSSAPWRSELIIPPCAPILWYLSAGHGPAHQRLRPPGAH
jgi:hypothetical protein